MGHALRRGVPRTPRRGASLRSTACAPAQGTFHCGEKQSTIFEDQRSTQVVALALRARAQCRSMDACVASRPLVFRTRAQSRHLERRPAVVSSTVLCHEPHDMRAVSSATARRLTQGASRRRPCVLPVVVCTPTRRPVARESSSRAHAPRKCAPMDSAIKAHVT